MYNITYINRVVNEGISCVICIAFIPIYLCQVPTYLSSTIFDQ